MATLLTGSYEKSLGLTFVKTSTFINPDVLNRLDPDTKPVNIKDLRYRVRFRYPIDPLLPDGEGPTVDPQRHYLLDTPVFDDITVYYDLRPRILDYHRVTE